MKRLVAKRPWILLLLALMLAGSCGKGVPTLYVYNFTVYMPQEVLRAFEKRYGVRVIYEEFTTNEEMLAKLQSGATGYDVVFPSGDHVSIMAKLGLLEPLDKSKLTHFTNLDAGVLRKIRFDPGNRYSIPYLMGASGIAVNRAKVKSFEKSFTIFDRADLKGRMTLLDDMREILGAALSLKGYSVNTTNEKELLEAKKTVMGWKKNIQRFDAESFGKAFAAGEFWVVSGYGENIWKAMEGNEAMKSNTVFFLPREGGSMYMDNMVILKSSRNKELAHQFLQFVHEPEIYAKIAMYFQLPSVNRAADRFITNVPHYRLSDLERFEFKEDLGPAVERYNRLWQEIRVEN